MISFILLRKDNLVKQQDENELELRSEEEDDSAKDRATLALAQYIENLRRPEYLQNIRQDAWLENL